MRTVRLTRGRIGVATAAIAGISSAVTMLALDVAPASATTTQNWATGVTATGSALNIPATPHVASSGSVLDKSEASVPSNPALTAQLLHVSAETGAARASVADLNLGSGQIKASVVEASCQEGAGESKLADAVISGHQVPAAVPPNTTIAVPPTSPVASVILNKQAPDGHGGVKVSAIEASLKLPSSPAAQKVDISTADCASAPTGNGSTPSAPAPNPQQGNLSVTG